MGSPRLEPPGAGLPFLEALLVRWYVGPFQSRRADKRRNLKQFALLGARILKEAGGVADGKRDQRVLVPRMKGIEDSSRFWSINETLEHLMITGLAMREVIASLARGEAHDRSVRIEDFKPKGRYAGGDARQDFRAFVDGTTAFLEPLPIVDGGPTHRHPWLGPFNALQWTWLLAGHSGIHLNQLVAIKKEL